MFLLAVHAAHDAGHHDEQWRRRGLRQNVCDHLGGGWVIATCDALDIDAVLRDGFSDAMKSQINVPRSFTCLVVSIRNLASAGDFTALQPSIFVRAKPAKGQLCAAQSMLIWPGIELLGCSRSSRKIRNNVLYTVRQLTEELVYLSAPHTEELLPLQYAQVAELLRLSYAQTYASCQGTEFEGSLRLHDTQSKHFSRRHLFEALSRAKRADQIAVAS